MILPSVLLLIALIGCQQSPEMAVNDLAEDWQELRRVDGEIERRRGRQRYLELKLSRLFEHSMKFNEENLKIDQLELLPSISLPYKDNMHYAMILRRNHNFYTLRGDIVFSKTENPTLVSSIRNEHTYFAEFLPNSTVKISKIKIANKKTSAQLEIFIDLSTHSNVSFDCFIAAHHSTTKYYIFASKQAKTMLILQRNGSLVKTINTNRTIISVKKVSNNIVVLTEDQLFFFNVNKNITKTACLMPHSPIQNFDFDQANLKYIYGQQQDTIYQFELTSQCRPIKQFHILPNSSFFLAGQLLFLSTPELNYAINTTNSRSMLFSFPFGSCLGPRKIAINRKIQSNYIISQICLGETHINMTHMLLQLQDALSEVTDFSKFRIPLLFLSFGIIIYVTVKNKGKDKDKSAEQANQKQIQEDILKRIANMKQKPQQPPNSSSSPSSQPIFEKRLKKQ